MNSMMNMTSSSATNMTMPVMAMMPFHTMVGMDMLWFSTWMPTDAGSTFGACVGLFLLAVFYRFIIAVRCVAAIRTTVNVAYATKNINQAIHYPTFDLKRELQAGILEGLVSFIGYALMLAVMLMNAWFFIAILLGIIVGETSFGRFGRCTTQPGALLDAKECC